MRMVEASSWNQLWDFCPEKQLSVNHFRKIPFYLLDPCSRGRLASTHPLIPVLCKFGSLWVLSHVILKRGEKEKVSRWQPGWSHSQSGCGPRWRWSFTLAEWNLRALSRCADNALASAPGLGFALLSPRATGQISGLSWQACGLL